jgi:hypothetical protein
LTSLLGGVRFPGLLAIPILLDHHHRVSQDGVQGIRVRFTITMMVAMRMAVLSDGLRVSSNGRGSAVAACE